MNIDVLPIKPSEAYPWLLLKHYAKRLCPISYAFGVYVDGVLSGVVTYGVPASSTLRSGICGGKYKDIVIELNRLCCLPIKNIASCLVGRSLRLIPPPAIVVSYADVKHGHTGYVYQASNFVYTGLSEKRTDWKIKGLEHLHGATVADMSRGQENRADFMRSKFGDDFYLEQRSRKHRYVFFLGTKKQKNSMAESLRYKKMPYPKSESSRYHDGSVIETQNILFYGAEL